MNANNPNASNVLTQSTGALVDIQSRSFLESDPDTVEAYLIIRYNGPAGSTDNAVQYPRTATEAARDNAIRALVNEMLDRAEPGNSLNATDIQIW